MELWVSSIVNITFHSMILIINVFIHPGPIQIKHSECKTSVRTLDQSAYVLIG